MLVAEERVSSSMAYFVLIFKKALTAFIQTYTQDIDYVLGRSNLGKR